MGDISNIVRYERKGIWGLNERNELEKTWEVTKLSFSTGIALFVIYPSVNKSTNHNLTISKLQQLIYINSARIIQFRTILLLTYTKWKKNNLK